ncbi:MAG TPA: hypothetical protein DER64_20365 [Planctomycetaceae bacterium]|nr:hypothetical protein [Planctomycetaceae bacterium]
MKSGKCPKCGSSDLSPRTWTKMAFVKKIICQECLYVELWADNPEQAGVSRRKLVLVYCVVFGITAALVAVPWILALLRDG